MLKIIVLISGSGSNLQAGADTSTLKCTTAAEINLFDLPTIIVGDFNTGCISTDPNNMANLAGLRLVQSGGIDCLSVATHENNAQRIAGFFKYDNPIMISEATEGFKLNFATTKSVSIDSSQDMGNNKIWMVKVGADPFTVKVETQTKRSRGAWR